MLVTVGFAAHFTALSGGLSSKVLGKMTFATQGKKSTARDASDVNRLNGPSKVLTATDGQQINLTANYFSRFNHVIGKLPGHGHVKNRQMNTVTDGPCWPRHHCL